MPKAPKIILAASTLLGLLIVATAAYRIFQGATASPPHAFMIGFEAIALLAGVFAILVGRGKFADGPGIALLSVAGVVAVASAVSYSTSLGRQLTDSRMLREPFTGGRLALAAATAALAGLIVLSRRPKESIRLFVIGLIWTGVACAIAAPAVVSRGALRGLNPVLITVGSVVGFVIFVGFLSAGIHYLIRAFETGRNPVLDPANAGRRAA